MFVISSGALQDAAPPLPHCTQQAGCCTAYCHSCMLTAHCSLYYCYTLLHTTAAAAARQQQEIMADDIAALGGHAAALWGSPPNLWDVTGRVVNSGLDIQDEGN
jgi:hypothetical protein